MGRSSHFPLFLRGWIRGISSLPFPSGDHCFRPITFHLSTQVLSNALVFPIIIRDLSNFNGLLSIFDKSWHRWKSPILHWNAWCISNQNRVSSFIVCLVWLVRSIIGKTIGFFNDAFAFLVWESLFLCNKQNQYNTQEACLLFFPTGETTILWGLTESCHNRRRRRERERKRKYTDMENVGMSVALPIAEAESRLLTTTGDSHQQRRCRWSTPDSSSPSPDHRIRRIETGWNCYLRKSTRKRGEKNIRHWIE